MQDLMQQTDFVGNLDILKNLFDDISYNRMF